jgi:hypothetical protein
MNSLYNFLTSGFIIGSFSLMALAPISFTETEDAAEEPPSTAPREAASVAAMLGELSPDRYDEVLWLARIIYSETKRPDEMRLVAWVARNRVDIGFRGTTYYSVATAPGQFSGLNASDSAYYENISLGRHDMGNPAWVRALEIANEVANAPASKRPFPTTVLHFYSPHILNAPPEWASRGELYLAIRSEKGGADRFHFYDNVK